MKGKILVGYETGETEYVDCKFDESLISMMYYTIDNIVDESIDLHIGGKDVTLKRNKELLDFLYKKFD